MTLDEIERALEVTAKASTFDAQDRVTALAALVEVAKVREMGAIRASIPRLIDALTGER